jgi:mono/diheme cytochrome c family protein
MIRSRKVAFCISVSAIASLLISSCQGNQGVEFNQYYSGGSLVYQTHCQNCHGLKGEGLQGLIPPLTDNIYLNKNSNELPCAIKYGLKGKLRVMNREFEGQMPANDLSPIDIAKVLTYVTNSFGNKGATITAEKVDSLLLKCK